MIKQLIFTSTKDFSANKITIEFSKNINVIIGPKGGGKSTLFDLLAGLKNNYISENVIKALEAYNLKFQKAIKFSNEEINISQLQKIKNKEKESDYETRSDVIYQDDKIKKDLTNAKEIEKEKDEYIKRQVSISEDVSKFIFEIKKLYLSMNKIDQYSKTKQNDINWSNTFNMNQLIKNSKLDLITKLNYKTLTIDNLIDEELKEYQAFENSINSFEIKLKKIQNLDKNLIINDHEFETNLNKHININLTSIDAIKKLISIRKTSLNKIKLTTNIFYQSYKKMIEKIKSENYSSEGLKTYEIAAKNYFKDFATDIKKLINDFENLYSKTIILNIKNDNNDKNGLIYKIPENLKLSEESKTEILKVVFNSPNSSRDDVDKWLKSLANKGIKDFDDEKLKKRICKEIKDDVKIYVNFDGEEKDYDSLSLGQKSIYGLKYKFEKSINLDLFLDQPEDNLDNHTITNEILKLIKRKNNQQVFIVTHNANIGILSNPEKVIIANLINNVEPYKITDIQEMINKESAYYLEGGKEFLEKRYNKIISNKGVN